MDYNILYGMRISSAIVSVLGRLEEAGSFP